MTKEGLKKPNYWGSLTQASTCRVGNFKGEEVYIPFNKMLPMVHPNDIVLGGWDISSLNLAESMERAQVATLLRSNTSIIEGHFHLQPPTPPPSSPYHPHPTRP
jgi:hypothetical protein